MIERHITSELETLAQQYPVITVVGPRQSGKTTLVKMTFPDKTYVSLEDPDIRVYATEDPRAFLANYPAGAILDEIQRVPQLLSYLQAIVDENNQPGHFILTGSHQLQLKQEISQSLAGRTTFLQLLPCSYQELYKLHPNWVEVNQWLIAGSYPRIHIADLNPYKAYRAYTQTYLERDLSQLIRLKDLSLFQRFMRLCAGRIGGILNKHSLASDLGISSSTVEHWIAALEASYIVFRLQPYFENFGKRIIKSPKLYFCDTGLACYLLGIETMTQLDRDPLKGALFENWVFLELAKIRYNRGLDHQLYFYRDQHGHEVDFIYQTGNELIPIEVKVAQTMHKDFTRGVKAFQKLVGEQRVPQGFVVYTGASQPSSSGIDVVSYQDMMSMFKNSNQS